MPSYDPPPTEEIPLFTSQYYQPGRKCRRSVTLPLQTVPFLRHKVIILTGNTPVTYRVSCNEVSLFTPSSSSRNVRHKVTLLQQVSSTVAS